MCVFSIEILLALLGLVLLLVEAFMPATSRRVTGWAALGGLGVALLLLTTASSDPASLPAWVRPFHQLDTLAMFYKGFAVVITLLVVWLMIECEPTLKQFLPEGRLGEMVSLPLIVCAGMMWMASARDLVTVFVSLELVTVSFYVLVAATRKSGLALEAGVKYLILGALSTGVLVFGVAWVYGVTGSLTFDGIARAVQSPSTDQIPLLFGLAFLLGGLGFKVAAAPFHMWVPDVYQGTSTPITTYLSVGSKAAGFVVLTRVVEAVMVKGSIVAPEVEAILLVSGGLTILLGGLPAMFQSNVKRMLAYSSISHAGFLLLALACRDSVRFNLAPGGVVAFYLATYLPMTVLAFLSLGLARTRGVAEDLDGLKGFARRSPLLALLFTVALASLAGLPLTAGFLGKMLVFIALVDHGYWGSLGCAVVGAAAGFYYYFRPILAMYSSTDASADEPVKLAPASKAVALALAAVVLLLGLYPRPLQRVLDSASGSPVAAVGESR